MTLRPALLSILLAATAAVPASALEIVRVLPGWRDAASFKRIAEYFTGREHTGGEVLLRTYPEQRAGYYFLLRVADAGGPRDIRVRLTVFAPGAAEPRTHVLPARLTGNSTVLNLGLTGPDWPDPKANPVAWKVEVLDAADEAVLAAATSYLWEQPAQP